MHRARQRFAGARNNRTLAYDQKSLLDESPGDDRSGTGEDAGKGWSRDSHPLGGRLLVQPLEISQSKRFELVHAQGLDLELRGPTADRFEAAPLPHTADHSELLGSCHHTPSYEHMLIIMICQGKTETLGKTPLGAVHRRSAQQAAEKCGLGDGQEYGKGAALTDR